jgi:SAM-dependent methyltransferase
MKKYRRGFYDHQQERSRQSAREIVPLVLNLFKPSSVVDVGCGTGAWLSVFREFDVNDILGIDGRWVDIDMLLIPDEKFLPADVERPIVLKRRFDLAISLEVAEHLHEKNAGIFIDSLVSLAPVILFSAAIPGQGGTCHRNEQWPEYWAGRFLERGYVARDIIRKTIWRNDNVEWWYAQNMLLFVRAEYLEQYPLLAAAGGQDNGMPLSLVHPKQFRAAVNPQKRYVQRISSVLKKVLQPPSTAGKGRVDLEA